MRRVLPGPAAMGFGEVVTGVATAGSALMDP